MDAMQSLKIVGIGIWVFVNLTMLGLLVYVYLLWSVYWKMVATPKTPVLETSIQKSSQTAAAYSPWQLGKAAAAVMASSQAMAMAKQGSGMTSYDDRKPRYFWNDTIMLNRLAIPTDKLQDKVEAYKNQLIVKLRQTQLDASNVLLSKEISKNTYNVQYQGAKLNVNVGKGIPSGNTTPPSTKSVVCSVKTKVKTRFLDQQTQPFKSNGLGRMFPADAGSGQKWSSVLYNSCAVVSSAGSLYKASLGKLIDSHDAVLRFNSAPTEGYENDVGSKTTFRILNSQVVSKPEFHFLTSPLYKNITLFAWDPSNYTVDIEEWYKHPDFDLFSPYFEHRKLHPEANFYILHPQMIWDSWAYLQQYTSVPIMKHPPSSGFLGILMMINFCNHVYVYEYIPSMRLTKRCHYFDIHENLACTFGAWHPLSSEKMLALTMNSGSDIDVFDTGVLYIKGVSTWEC
ncbi:ST6 beta-galactosamide alpha-2,6-sialyltransferase [Chamberlinius hualienensis]